MKNRVATALIAALTMTGCSALLVKRAPYGARARASTQSRPIDCGTSNVFPIIDTGAAVFAGSIALGSASAVAADDGPSGVNIGPLAVIGAVIFGVVAYAAGSSAASGFSATSRCRELNADPRIEVQDAPRN
jgi:hypothetical protein